MAEKADSISQKAVADFASTKHDKVPERTGDDADTKKAASPTARGDPTRSMQTHPWIGDGSELAKTAALLAQSAPKMAEGGARDGSISAFLEAEWIAKRGANGGYATENTAKTARAEIPKSLSPMELTAAMFAEQFIDSYVPQNKRPQAFSAYRGKQAGQPSQTVAPSRRCWRGPTSTPSQGQQIYPRTL